MSAYTYIGYAGAVKPTGRADMILTAVWRHNLR